MIPSSELTILRHLAGRTYASASAIGTGCAMMPGEVRARLVSLESRRLIGSRQDKATVPARRVYFLTAEGRRAAGIIDTRSTVPISEAR